MSQIFRFHRGLTPELIDMYGFVSEACWADAAENGMNGKPDRPAKIAHTGVATTISKRSVDFPILFMDAPPESGSR